MHVIHKDSTKCVSTMQFECPTCETKFNTGDNLNKHMELLNENGSSLSLILESSSLSWINLSCNECGNQFQNEKDVVDHKLLMHTKLQTNKRIIQNLKDTDFNEDSDEDKDYQPNEEELESTTKKDKEYLEWIHLR